MSTAATTREREMQRNRGIDRTLDGRDHASLTDVKQDVTALTHDAADYAKGIAETGVDAVKSGAEAIADTGRRAAEAARRTQRQVTGYVSDHPMTSVLIAFGVGAIMARLLMWRR